ncbi:hypothetical protein [Marimonas arenosa]|uniref:TspO/MBR related protein n=1 Tax=Marimonas arenosa TaxID=1795305 RepID=A0AAE3WGH4_9RHOB|nr:hypothetical protein [Marimonas arenosa]MDQ2091337.1 hypothetical protein [Marimonas arenosa]
MLRNIPLLALAVLLTTIAFALAPMLSRGFAGFTPEQFPVELEVWPVQPDGWAFAIWGVIYVWLILGALWGLINAPRDRDWQAMRQPLLASLGVGVFWIAAANASPILATVMLYVMAGFAIAALLRAGAGVPVWQRRPVALYAGWLTAATGVGTGVVLGGYGVLSAQVAALVMLASVLVTALAVQLQRPTEWAYPLAVIWALAGVISANLPSQNWPVVGLAAVGIITLTLGFVFSLRRGPRRQRR